VLREKIIELIKDVRGKGFRLEADLLMLAVEIAMAAVSKQNEVYKHSLISLHDIACERLDELDPPTPEVPKHTRLN
jgi:hypothetical protein